MKLVPGSKYLMDDGAILRIEKVDAYIITFTINGDERKMNRYNFEENMPCLTKIKQTAEEKFEEWRKDKQYWKLKQLEIFKAGYEAAKREYNEDL